MALTRSTLTGGKGNSLEAGQAAPKDSESTGASSETRSSDDPIVRVTGRRGGIGFTGMPAKSSRRSSKTTEPPAPETTTTGTKGSRTPEEQAILDFVARTNGQEWAERHAHRILEEARLIGEL